MLKTGTPIGPYEIVALLGAGGMGEVYRARDTRLGRDVALKVLGDGFLEDASSIARFQQEARLVGSLDHPNVLAVHDFGEHQGKPYLVTELLDGESLRQRLSAAALPQAKALALALQIAQGLAAAHDRGIVHRDLKPDNVFLTRDGRAKILDFGIAKLLPAAREGTLSKDSPLVRTSAGAPIGTPAYMSPEQVRGLPADARSDVFSFGCVVYEMLAGAKPFTGNSGMDLGAAILHDEPAALGVAVPKRVARVVSHCLEKLPELRFQSARDLVFVLEDLVADAATFAAEGRAPALETRVNAIPESVDVPTGKPLAKGEPRPGDSGPTTQTASPRKRRLIAAVALCVLAGVAAWTVRAPGRRAAPVASVPATPSIAVLAFADLSPQKDQEYFSDGLAEELLDALAHVEGLHVAGRTSSFSFKGKNEDVRSVGQKLSVAHVLEGSVRKAGNRVRVTAQLISADNGFHLWSQSYDRELTDIFAVQDDIARSVVQALRVKLLAGQAPSSERHRTTNPEVYRLYLLGRKIADRYPPRDMSTAERALKGALAIEPGYAPAWAALATALWQHPDEDVAVAAEALRAADKAISLDPRLAEGYVARGNLRAGNWDWTGALADVDQALAVQPLQVEALLLRGMLLAGLGRMADGLVSVRRAVDLDPISGAAAHALVWMQVGDGQFAEARLRAEKLLEVIPESALALSDLAAIHLFEGRPGDALATFANRPPDFFSLTMAAMAHHDLGHQGEAQRALDLMKALVGAHAAGLQMAWIYAWWGQPDTAFEWLESAWREHDTGLGDIKYDPFLKKLRGDPRYAALLKKLNLPD